MYVNLYGPTEITCNCTYYILDRPFDIGDVVQAIDIILNQNAGGVVSIADVIELIDYILIM